MNDVYDEGLARQQEKLAATADMVAQRKAMLSLLNLKTGDHVIYVGSGNGIFVRDVLEIVGSSGHACGTDISEIMVGLAQNDNMERFGRVMQSFPRWKYGPAIPAYEVKFNYATQRVVG